MKSGILGSVNAVLNRIRELKTSTEIDTSVARQKYITNQALNDHRRTALCTRCAWDTGAQCRARFEIIWSKVIAAGDVANRTVDAVPIDPNVRVSEPVEPAPVVSLLRWRRTQMGKETSEATRRMV